MTTGARRVADDENGDDDLACKRRRMNDNDDDCDHPGEKDPNLLLLFHDNSHGVSAEGNDRSSLEDAHDNNNTNIATARAGLEGSWWDDSTNFDDDWEPPKKWSKHDDDQDDEDCDLDDQEHDNEQGDFMEEEQPLDEESELKLAENFFLRNPFTQEEFEDVEQPIKEQMEKSVALLEKEGYAVFKKWRSKNQVSTVTAKTERKRMEQAIQDAKIMGAPRQYQQRLFEIACKQNTIIHLGTGAGKTLIALMLIRHFASDFQKGKQTLFAVPSVALAIQQSTVLRSNLPFSVQVACYSTSTTEKARKSLQECNILVATHGAVSILHDRDVCAPL